MPKILLVFLLILTVEVASAENRAIKQQTEALIHQHRVGKLTIKTQPNATVTVPQLKHEFLFGTALNSASADERSETECTAPVRRG